MHVKSMDHLDCTKFLEAHRLGHLACSVGNQPYVVPIHYALKNTSLYSFSMPGKKVDIMRQNPHVSVLVEDLADGSEWKSVVVAGHFEELPDRIGSKIERDHAWSLLSQHANWWEPGSLKPVDEPILNFAEHLFYRIVIDDVSGREAVG